MTNTLYCGDNLHVLREHVASESVDLFYLDPPFNFKANHNALCRSPDGQTSDAQIKAFEDPWHLNDRVESACGEVMRGSKRQIHTLSRTSFAHRVGMREPTIQARYL